MSKRPYIIARDPNFGTREYVEMFLSNFVRLREFMNGGPAQQVAYDGTLFKRSPKNFDKQYIGSARVVPSGRNPFESLWCAKIDIAHACEQLELHERLALGCKYLRGEDNIEIAKRLQTTSYMTNQIILGALDKIAVYLDGLVR
jgi:hypothetical protein